MTRRFERFLLLLPLLTMLSCSGKETMEHYLEDITYRTLGNDWQNYYLTIVPQGQIRGLIVLLPGFGMPPEKFLYEIKFDSIAAQNGLVLIVPSPQGWGTHYLDDASIDTLNAMILEASRRYKMAGNPFVVGGFSIGGTGALRYAERIADGTLKQEMTLAGAFAVDSPLDLDRLWYSFQKQLEQGPSQEAEYFLNALKNNLGGSPKEQALNYVKSSPFMASEHSGGRAQLLKNLPLRFYVEPDTLWWKANGWLDYEHQNARDLELLVLLLRRLGNDRAELVTTTNKGFRKNGKRHPHSWSIVDERELADWILKTMEER